MSVDRRRVPRRSPTTCHHPSDRRESALSTTCANVLSIALCNENLASASGRDDRGLASESGIACDRRTRRDTPAAAACRDTRTWAGRASSARRTRTASACTVDAAGGAHRSAHPSTDGARAASSVYCRNRRLDAAAVRGRRRNRTRRASDRRCIRYSSDFARRGIPARYVVAECRTRSAAHPA